MTPIKCCCGHEECERAIVAKFEKGRALFRITIESKGSILLDLMQLRCLIATLEQVKNDNLIAAGGR